MPGRAFGVQNGILTPADYAHMVRRGAAPFVVDDQWALRPSMSGDQVTVADGYCWVAGTLVRFSRETITVPRGSSSNSEWGVVLQLDWSNAASPVKLAVADVTAQNVSTSSSSGVFRRVPGVRQDSMICIVRGSTNRKLLDGRVWGGDGGPFFVEESAWSDPRAVFFNLQKGARICPTSDVELVKVLNGSGEFEVLGGGSKRWQSFTPTLITQGDYYGSLDGNRVDREVQLGSGGTMSGRFRVVDGVLHGYVHVYTGNNPSFGHGYIGMQLPMPMSTWLPEVNAAGYIAINPAAVVGAIPGQPAELPASMRIFSGAKYALLFIAKNGTDGVFWAHRVKRDSSDSNFAYGIPAPKNASASPHGVRYKFAFEYPVDL